MRTVRREELTQVLMDIANQVGGLVIGTGDMSELALGWATYNGDHMSMYGVNVSRAEDTGIGIWSAITRIPVEEELRTVLLDVLDTPSEPGAASSRGTVVISQKTEDLVGPYQLPDFYLHYVLRFGFITRSAFTTLACYAFQGQYDKETILKWLKHFTRRFFSQPV